jgi:hypothetical protein
VPVLQNGGDHVVPVDEYVRADFHRFADRPFDGEAAIVDARTDAVDDDAAGEAFALQCRIAAVRPLTAGRRLTSGD